LFIVEPRKRRDHPSGLGLRSASENLAQMK
jgi:hypothetical protein